MPTADQQYAGKGSVQYKGDLEPTVAKLLPSGRPSCPSLSVPAIAALFSAASMDRTLGKLHCQGWIIFIA
jgi:hypothetical protein